MTGALRRFKLTVLMLGDLIAAYLALVLTLLLRYGTAGFEAQWIDHAKPFTLVFALWIVIFYVVGLYDLDAMRSRIELAGRTAEALVAALLISIAVFYAAPGVGIAPKTNLLIAIVVYAAFFIGWRLASMHFFSLSRFRLRVLFVGGEEEARTLSDVLAANPQLGYSSIGQFNETASAKLPDTCDLIVVSRNLQSKAEVTARLYQKFFQGTEIIDLPTFYEKIRHSVPESALDERWIIDNLAGQESGIYEQIKRFFDVLLAILFALPTLALTPLIALAIWLNDRGPVFYAQKRAGRGGRSFSIVKFRTMRVDAEKHGAAFAQARDPRVTAIGRFLRATRLDELPQLWNILRGEMSFVGPRPERPEIEDELSKTIPLFPVRRLVRPGLTGWAQVSAPYASTLEDHLLKLRHDLYYLKYRSLMLDATIVLKTFYSVLKRKGR